MMCWFVIYVDYYSAQNAIDILNKNQNIKAFIPKMERWYINKHRRYALIELCNSHLIFVKTSEQTDMQLPNIYKKYMLKNDNEKLINHLFCNDGIVHCSYIILNDQKIQCIKGPLMGYEDRVIRIDEYHKLAELDINIFGENLKVPYQYSNVK